MVDKPAEGGRPAEGSSTTLAERDRILAAAGWEKDPRRRRILRDLLREHSQHIYLHAYADGGARAAAMDRTRRALLRTARTIDQVPDGCSISAWIFLGLEAESGRAMDCPEAWRILGAVEKEVKAAPAASLPANASADLVRHLDAHPGCRDMGEEYRRFLRLNEDPELLARSGLHRAVQDLDHFFKAQFGEETPEGVSGRHPWRQLLPRWGQSRGVAIAFGVVVVALGLLLWRAWQSGHMGGRPAELRGRAVAEHGLPGERNVAPHTDWKGARIEGAQMALDGSELVFRWEKTDGADRYRTRILTSKLDTLEVIDSGEQTFLRVPSANVRGLTQGGSYLFQIDGLHSGRVVATTGLKPFQFR